jgi:hypothetical protein
MVGREKINELRLRKQALILESELNRLALRTECQNLWAATAGLSGKAKAGYWGWALAPVAGFLTMRLFRRAESGLGRALSALKWLQPLYALWKSFGGKRKKPAAQTPIIL